MKTQLKFKKGDRVRMTKAAKLRAKRLSLYPNFPVECEGVGKIDAVRVRRIGGIKQIEVRFPNDPKRCTRGFEPHELEMA